MHGLESCSCDSCPRPVVTIFRLQSLCLEHFCRRSYEFLDTFDRHLQSNATSPVCTREQLQVADECARRTLDICLSKMILNNLDRARLLDILLWSGDIVRSSHNLGAAGPKEVAKTRYEAPQLRRLAAGGVLPN